MLPLTITLKVAVSSPRAFSAITLYVPASSPVTDLTLRDDAPSLTSTLTLELSSSLVLPTNQDTFGRGYPRMFTSNAIVAPTFSDKSRAKTWSQMIFGAARNTKQQNSNLKIIRIYISLRLDLKNETNTSKNLSQNLETVLMQKKCSF